MSAISHSLQGKGQNDDVYSFGTQSVGLGGGKLLPLLYFITLMIASSSFFNAWSKETFIWLRHAAGKEESNRQAQGHALTPPSR